MTYFSHWLKVDYPELYAQIIHALDKHRAPHKLLPVTNDVWCRDYMPIPLRSGGYLHYKYFPNYLNNNRDRKYITDAKVVSDSLGLDYTQTEIIVDGGNVVRCGDKVVMIDKIFSENPHYSQAALIDRLECLLEAELVFLPWDRAEKYGHSDGVVRDLCNGKVLLTNYKDYDEQIHEKFYNILSRHFQVEELSYTRSDQKDSSWAYINFLQTDEVIILPKLCTHKDVEALEQMNRYFPQYEGRIEMVDARSIIKDGEAFNCISWNS